MKLCFEVLQVILCKIQFKFQADYFSGGKNVNAGYWFFASHLMIMLRVQGSLCSIDCWSFPYSCYKLAGSYKTVSILLCCCIYSTYDILVPQLAPGQSNMLNLLAGCYMLYRTSGLFIGKFFQPLLLENAKAPVNHDTEYMYRIIRSWSRTIESTYRTSLVTLFSCIQQSFNKNGFWFCQWN